MSEVVSDASPSECFDPFATGRFDWRLNIVVGEAMAAHLRRKGSPGNKFEYRKLVRRRSNCAIRAEQKLRTNWALQTASSLAILAISAAPTT